MIALAEEDARASSRASRRETRVLCSRRSWCAHRRDAGEKRDGAVFAFGSEFGTGSMALVPCDIVGLLGMSVYYKIQAQGQKALGAVVLVVGACLKENKEWSGVSNRVSIRRQE